MENNECFERDLRRFKGVSRIFQRSPKGVSKKFEKCFESFSRKFQGSVKDVKFQAYFKEILRFFQVCFNVF